MTLVLDVGNLLLVVIANLCRFVTSGLEFALGEPEPLGHDAQIALQGGGCGLGLRLLLLQAGDLLIGVLLIGLDLAATVAVCKSCNFVGFIPRQPNARDGNNSQNDNRRGHPSRRLL